MTIERLSRRDFSVGLAWLFPALGATSAKGSWNPGISRKAEAIHQEVVFEASPKRIYEVFLDAAQFSKMTGGLATEIAREVGGAFTLFGGKIAGRHVDLVPGAQIVQGWRSEGWKPHLYSIARFDLTEQGSGTRLIFDHTGFPAGEAEHLASGWKDHYWDPLARYLASRG